MTGNLEKLMRPEHPGPHYPINPCVRKLGSVWPHSGSVYLVCILSILWEGYSRAALRRINYNQSCLTLYDPMDWQPTEFSLTEYWSGEPIPSPGDLPNPGIKPGPPTLQVDSLPTELSGKPPTTYAIIKVPLFNNHYVE